MNDMATPAAEDAAWAAVNTPLEPDALKAFCRDIERLFRINPMLEFRQWQSLGNDRYRFSGRNISQETPFEFETELQVSYEQDDILIDYDQGLKSSTRIRIEPSEFGSRLTITESYAGSSEQERQQRLHEVDKSLVTWADYLQRFLITWKRWSGFAAWRWYMKRVWQPMKPTGRRITYMLLWISVVEIALIALGAAIYFTEYA